MFEVIIFKKKLHDWEKIKEKILFLEKEAFAGGAFEEDVIKEDFLDENNSVILLVDKETKEVVGFTYAKPFEPETDDSPAKPGETAWIWNIVIQKEYRGRHLSGGMLDMIEKELKHRGFKYLEMNARVENNFAENISKHYKDRIIKSFPLDSRWGPQFFYRIIL